MSSALKTIFNKSCFSFTLILVIFIVTPSISLGEGGESIATQDSSLTVTTTSVATTSGAIITVVATSATATTTDNGILLLPQDDHTATSPGEVLGAPAINQHDESIEEDMEAVSELSPDGIVSVPQSPPLTTREFRKYIKIDKHAFHSCEVETFRIDVTRRPTATARIMLQRDSDVPYELEIGGLPQGIDVTFVQGGYRHAQGVNERTLMLSITNQLGSQKGNFVIPIIYTKKDSGSSTICQINIINR